MLKYFELEDYEILVFRFWIILMMIFIPVYGLFLLQFSEGAVDFMLHRWLISGYWAFFFFLSFLNVSVKKYLALPCFIGNFIAIAWILWVVNVNHFSADYSMGLFLSLSGIAIINRSNIEMIIFYVFSFSLLFYCFYVYPDTEISKMVFTLSVFILFLVHVIVMGKRDFINRNLRQLNQQLKFKNKRLKQLIYVSSHDLKTPIRNIGSFASLLQSNLEEDELEKEESKKYMGFILQGALSMDKKIDDLLEFFKFDNPDIETKEIKIQNLFEEVEKTIINLYPNENIFIQWPKEIPPILKVESHQIQQLFHHLIDNGVKYNHSENKEILITYSSNYSHHIFNIRDNGIGIEMKYKNKIFDLFQRLHLSDEFSGTGVGLAICKTIVENHEGEIRLESGIENKGSEFVFTLKRNGEDPTRICFKKNQVLSFNSILLSIKTL